MPGTLVHRRGTLEDVGLLAALNQQLIHDEGHHNRMSVAELETRMRSLIADEYTTTLFERDNSVAAYALWRDRPDHFSLRHFFVARDHRRQGVGRAAMQMLRDEVWPPGKRVRVEVLVGNVAGLAFWRSVGFTDYLLALEMER